MITGGWSGYLLPSKATETIRKRQIRVRKFDLVRLGGGVTEIRENEVLELRASKDSMEDAAYLTDSKGGKIAFELEDRPIVEVIGGHNVITQNAKSITTIRGEKIFHTLEFSAN